MLHFVKLIVRIHVNHFLLQKCNGTNTTKRYDGAGQGAGAGQLVHDRYVRSLGLECCQRPLVLQCYKGLFSWSRMLPAALGPWMLQALEWVANQGVDLSRIRPLKLSLATARYGRWSRGVFFDCNVVF